MSLKYTTIVQWSEEDGCFLVSLPEFTDVMQPATHGFTYEEAAKHSEELLEILIDIYRQDGKPLPQAKTLEKSVS
ncbi:MAG: type II toxin-antitoxin system HicB family antitoxin [Cyanobacteriota bacterium]|nr:type II toxin-antitoxin system HicB family antitoxin [Cyanobacteriota bacterium]